MFEEVIQTLLNLPDITVTRVERTKTGDYLITLESTLSHTLCRTCGRQITTFHGYDDWITLQHLPLLGSKVFLRLRPKRFRCPFCSDHPTTTQTLAFYRQRSPFTKAFEEHLLLACIHSTIADVCLKEQVGYAAIEGLLDHYIAATIDWHTFKALGVVGIDEIALRKGHRNFVTIVSCRLPEGQIRVLAVLPDRAKATVEDFFHSIPYRLRRTVSEVCSDMYEGFLSAIEAVFGPQAVVIDRFHVAKHYRAAADRLRQAEMARLKRERSAEQYACLEGAIWYFRKRRSELSLAEQDVLECLFGAAPSLRQAYELREALTALFETAYTVQQAREELQQWMERVQTSGLDCFDDFLKLLETHLDGIVNYFRNRSSSGFVEGLNNKLKVLKRRCYGIFNLNRLFQRLTLDVEGYALVQRLAQTTK